MKPINIKRVYEPPEKEDGFRILVDRLWPRGMKKEQAHVDEWMKAIAPSVNLRKWFGHDPAKWEEFRLKYLYELKQNDKVKDLTNLVREHKTVTLLYAAHDELHNHALVLQYFMNKLLKE